MEYDLDKFDEYSPAEQAKILDSLEGEVTVSDEPQKAAAEPAKTEAKADVKPEPTAQVEATQENTGDKNAAPPAAPAEADENAKGVLSRDGKHVIPYDVLEAARARARQSDERFQQQGAELAETKRLLEQYQKQINSAGLTPADLPEKTQISQEQIKALGDDFPELAAVMQQMVDKISYLETRNAPVVSKAQNDDKAAEAQAAFNAIPALGQWQANDPDRWDQAVIIDERLQKDPAWKDRSPAERFAEVERRTKMAFGDPVQTEQSQPNNAELQKQAADKLAQAQAKAELPASPSDIGHGNNNAEKSQLEKFADANQLDIIRDMGKMTPQQIDKLLSEADGF